MKKELTRIAPLRVGIILGIMYGVLGFVIVVPFVLLASLAAAKTGSAAAFPVTFGPIFALLLPIFYAILGFIGGIIMAALYNLITGWTGGIQFEVRDVPPME